MKDLNVHFTVDQTPEEVFAAINDVRGWWSGDIEGSTTKLGDEFRYRYEDIHSSTQKVIECVPGKKVVWLVVDSFLSFVENKSEWNGTEITFDIAKKGKKTELRFTHRGLAPDHACFDLCSDAWTSYVGGSLRDLIAAGKGQPNKKRKNRPARVTKA